MGQRTELAPGTESHVKSRKGEGKRTTYFRIFKCGVERRWVPIVYRPDYKILHMGILLQLDGAALGKGDRHRRLAV